MGLTPPSDGVFEGDYMSDSGFDATDAILAKGFTAIFSTNDMMAYGILKRLRQLKIKVPRDISIVGFDDVVLNYWSVKLISSLLMVCTEHQCSMKISCVGLE